MDALQSASGFVVSVIVGLTGVGGGALMTPLLILVFGVAPATAVGTDLLYAAITKSAGAYVHARRGHVDWRTTAQLAAGSVPACLATLVVLHSLAASGRSLAPFLNVALGCALLLTAAALLLRGRLMRRANIAPDDASAARPVGVRAVAVGAVLGVLVTLTSVGAGALGTLALLALFPAMRTARIVGTDIAHAVPLTLVAGIGHATLGTIDWMLLASLLVGSIPGIWIGSHAASRVPEHWLRSTLAALLVFIGARFVL